jgi:hypothetical protein
MRDARKSAPRGARGNISPLENDRRNGERCSHDVLGIVKEAWHKAQRADSNSAEVTITWPRRDFESICAHIGTPEVAKSARQPHREN